jgi:hypothetical protein
MTFRATLWKGTSFLSIDPGINHTGFAHYRIGMQGELSLKDYGAVSLAKDGLDDLERAGIIVDTVMAHVNQKRPAFVFLERPPNTIYYQGKCSNAMLIARAQNVFKVVGITYAISVRVRPLTGLRLFPVEPVKWQERSPKKRLGLSIKDWSIKLANSIITQTTSNPANLGSERDENIADAISMGWIAFGLGMAG